MVVRVEGLVRRGWNTDVWNQLALLLGYHAEG